MTTAEQSSAAAARELTRQADTLLEVLRLGVSDGHLIDLAERAVLALSDLAEELSPGDEPTSDLAAARESFPLEADETARHLLERWRRDGT